MGNLQLSLSLCKQDGNSDKTSADCNWHCTVPGSPASPCTSRQCCGVDHDTTGSWPVETINRFQNWKIYEEKVSVSYCYYSYNIGGHSPVQILGGWKWVVFRDPWLMAIFTSFHLTHGSRRQRDMVVLDNPGLWFGLAVTRWSRSTKLLYARPG